MSNVASNTVPTNTKSRATTTFAAVMVFILVIVALYYLYKFMYGASGSLSSTTVLSSLTSTTSASNIDPNSAAVVNLTGVSQGGQYSLNMWVYVSSTKSNASTLVHLLDITGGTSVTRLGNTLLFIGLDPTDGTLIIRQSSSGEGDTQMGVSSTPSSTSSTPSSVSSYMNSLISGYMSSSGTSSYKQDDRCDIKNGIEYQRWVLVSVVANGRTLDVYLDGKLSRSCVYRGNNTLGVTSGNAVVTIGNRHPGAAIMTGYFSKTDYYNYALTPDLIWSVYQTGPTTSSSNFFSNLFSTNINFGTTSGLNK